MSASFINPPFMPCPDCGASVAVARKAAHVCDAERRLDFAVFQLRPELLALDAEIEGYLESPRGRFEQWCAKRARDARTPDPQDETG